MPKKTKDVKDEELNKKTKTEITKSTTKKQSSTTKVRDEKTTKKKTITEKTKKAVNSSKSKNNNLKASKENKTTSNKVDLVEYYDLPDNYNKTAIKVLAQTPNILFVYWEISLDDINRFKKQYGDNFFETTKPVLIVHNDSINYSFEVEINDFANSWYLHVNDTKCNYRIEIGRKPISNVSNINKDYIYISSSNEIESPNDKILFDKSQKMAYFRNTKTKVEKRKDISVSFMKNIGKIYNIYDLYKEIYNDNIDELYDLSNPSSRNPSSESISSKFM